ncbi:hypothetical protein J4E86_005926 [Alternaria arbusti]|uniref:uncharacterized protein n=1 Tax=Alternaria arbusti TaxID=232088 RepID=UPI00221E3C83|nr:uncharacterized protein J4E86_005926 [Alternaria arbusti]KAI4954616.1 hypothetical protein J4E86_005926 [Alternaria arbusti]
MRRNQLISLALLAPSCQAYVWPSKYDQLDDLLYLQSGYIRNGELSDQVQTCSFGARQPGIQKAAEWVRTNFHDAVTHDASTGIGGLDASIQYELDRPENLGAALNNTLSDMASSVNIRSSAADVLALSLVMSVARCADMRVPLRLGRKDAAEAGIKGVPEAHTDLDTTRKRFETASLTEKEMITLIACGHSIGGVHSVDHPEIVSGPVTAENKATFDTTSGEMDNAVVTEYLNNSTANPLVVNANNTLNSDKRIFLADDNATMRKLADKAYFKSQCEAAFEKLIHLVPGDVTLTEPMEPADIRPYITSYQLKDGAVELTGRLRVRTTPVTGRDGNTLTASLIPVSRNGSAPAEIVANRATYKLGTSSGYLDEVFQWFEFTQTLNATDAFDSFTIRVNDKTYDNGGTGSYPINPDVLYQEAQSCTAKDTTTGEWKMTITAAVFKALLQTGATPQLNVSKKTKVQGLVIPRLTPTIVEMSPAGKETAEYVYYTATTVLSERGLDSTFDIEVGESKVEFINANALTQQECAAL